MIPKLICFWIVIYCGVFSVMSKDVPAWLRQAATVDLSGYDKKASFVVLHDESKIIVSIEGRITRSSTFAIKILRNEGCARAVAREVYKTDTDKVREIRAWLIQSNGEVKSYEKNETIDAALVDNDVYNNVRQKVISAENDAAEGAVFGYETVLEEQSVFSQIEWFFQPHEPVLLSRLTVTPPPDWTVEAKTFNHPEIKPIISGESYVWELRNLPFIEPEPLAPSVRNIVPRLAVSLYPPANVYSQLQAFRNWADVSLWLTRLSDPQVSLDDAMKAKAEALIEGAQTELEKIEAIARFCQSISYISIQTGIGRGGGYQPHSATEIFAKAYGDCKDKTNLMRALLKAIGITSYPVSIYSGNRYYVREEWPSPQQFNHCIIAVKVSESIQAPAIIRHETFGSLLIFDPTDSYTRLGEIPGHEQGSLALLVAGNDGGLLRIPASKPEANRLERSLDMELSADGAINARVREEMTGEAATMGRAQFRELSQEAYTKMIERWISGTVRGSRVTKIDFQSDPSVPRPTLEVDFTAQRYAQLMQGRLLVFNPTIVSRRDTMELTEPTRKLPIVIESEAFEEKLHVKIPAGFAVDEIPLPIDLKTNFGAYQAEFSSQDGDILYKRSLVLRNAVLPAEQYDAVREFFMSVRNFEQSPIVLIKNRKQ